MNPTVYSRMLRQILKKFFMASFYFPAKFLSENYWEDVTESNFFFAFCFARDFWICWWTTGSNRRSILCLLEYIHNNWPLQPFSPDYWPSFSHYLCCVLILYISGGTLSQLWTTVFAIYWEKITEELRENHCILFWCLA